NGHKRLTVLRHMLGATQWPRMNAWAQIAALPPAEMIATLESLLVPDPAFQRAQATCTRRGPLRLEPLGWWRWNGDASNGDVPNGEASKDEPKKPADAPHGATVFDEVEDDDAEGAEGPTPSGAEGGKKLTSLFGFKSLRERRETPIEPRVWVVNNVMALGSF